MSQVSDVIVVGSGASGVHAATALVEGGASVTMLDVGHEDKEYLSLVPDLPFSRMRREDPAQHRYLLGDRFEGIPLSPLAAGAQITPPHQYVVRQFPELAAIVAPAGFAALESFALGGLAQTWGAVCFPFLDSEIVRSGLDPRTLTPHYSEVARRIGVSAGTGDILRLAGQVKGLQPPLDVDDCAARVLHSYRGRREGFQRAGIGVGQPFMAVLTEPLDGRRAHAYHAMEFWSDAGGSVYRPCLTLRRLDGRPSFSYQRPYLVRRFREEPDGVVSVYARALDTDREVTFQARVLVLAAGAFGTTRIVLRSLGLYDLKVPFACNAHTYVPCICYRMIGAPVSERAHGLAQLTMIYDPTGDQQHLVQGQMYSYRSLLLFRLLKESRFPVRESIRFVRGLASSLVIWVIQHEDTSSSDQFCRLCRSDDSDADYLEISYVPREEAERRRRMNERLMIRYIRRLGCWPLSIVRPPHGSSVHYGGHLPTNSAEKPLTTEPSGRLRGTRSVYIVDGAALSYLPAKGPTFTLMANANRVGEHVLRCLKHV